MKLHEPNAMKEIHAIRAENYERTKDFSPEERSRFRSESALPVAEKYGFRIVSKRNSDNRHQRVK